MVALGLCKVKVSSDIGYDVRVFIYDLTNQTLTRDSNYL